MYQPSSDAPEIHSLLPGRPTQGRHDNSRWNRERQPRLLYDEESTEPFTGFHENDEDGGALPNCATCSWEEQQYERRGSCYSVVEKICSWASRLTLFCAIFFGVSTLLVNPYLKEKNPLVFCYIAATLSVEFVLVTGIGLLLVCIKLTLGGRGRAYSNALCGISLRLFEGIAYYASLGVGLYIIARNRPIWQGWMHPFAVPDSTEDQAFKVSPACYAYIVFEIAMSLVYLLTSCPVICGGLGWLSHKLEMKLLGRPEVNFTKANQPVSYWNMSNYAQALHEMRNPLTGRDPDLTYIRQAPPPVSLSAVELQPLMNSA